MNQYGRPLDYGSPMSGAAGIAISELVCDRLRMEHGKDEGLDFFLSYALVDQAWAEWIAWTLEANGFHVQLQAWDSPAGSNWIQTLDAGVRDAGRMITVLSQDYLKSIGSRAEWQAVRAQDPEGTGQRLLPVRVSDCTQTGLLAGIVSIDLFGIDEETARCRLQEMIQGAIAGRLKPKVAPSFPGKHVEPHPPFPGAPAPDQQTGLARHDETERQSAASSIADSKPRNPLNCEESQEDTSGASVTDLSAFRLNSGRDSTDAPTATRIHDLIAELSESAESVSASYGANGSAYVWTRLELNRRILQVESYLEQASRWLSHAGIANDPDTFSLRHSIRLYAGTAEKFAEALASLEPSRSSSRQRGLLAEYEAARRALQDLLWRIHNELEVALGPSGPTGLR